MSENIANVPTQDGDHRMEPGIGLAMLAVLVMLAVTAVLFGLIYLLMVAISPIEDRGTRGSGQSAIERSAPRPPAAMEPPPAPPAVK